MRLALATLGATGVAIAVALITAGSRSNPSTGPSRSQRQATAITPALAAASPVLALPRSVEALSTWSVASDRVADRRADDVQRNAAMDFLVAHSGVTKQAVPILSRLVQDQAESSRVRSFAVQHLGQLQSMEGEPAGEARSLLLQLLADDDHAVRREALLALSRATVPAVIERLGDLLHDTDWQHDRDLLIRCFIEHGMVDRVPDVRVIAADEDADAPARIAAIEALGEWQDAASEAFLRSALTSANVRMQRAAALSLHRIGCDVAFNSPPAQLWHLPAEPVSRTSPDDGATALVFDQPEFTSAVAADVARVVAVFGYRNQGKRTVHITNIATSCGCTVASADQLVVDPGASGEIRATIAIEGMSGRQVKEVLVSTDDGGDRVIRLTIRLDIEPTLRVEPSLVRWKTGDATERKLVRVSVAPGVRVGHITPHDVPGFHVEVKQDGSDPSTWSLWLQPTDRRQPATETIRFDTDAGIVGRSDFHVIASAQ